MTIRYEFTKDCRRGTVNHKVHYTKKEEHEPAKDLFMDKLGQPFIPNDRDMFLFKPDYKRGCSKTEGCFMCGTQGILFFIEKTATR